MVGQADVLTITSASSSSLAMRANFFSWTSLYHISSKHLLIPEKSYRINDKNV